MPHRRVVIGLGVLGLTLPACGSDDEPADTEASRPSARTETRSKATATARSKATVTQRQEQSRAPATEAPAPEPPPTSPEDQRGGAGDEEPARTLALLTGRNGRITPQVVRVPAFISIRVELRAADDRSYGLRFDGRTLRAGGRLSSASTTLDGLRPGDAVTARALGGGSVRIEATAEPGP